MNRAYRLGRRQASVDLTARRILDAARQELAAGSSLSVGAVARRAGVTRATVYNRFGSQAGLLQRVAPEPAPTAQNAPSVQEYLLARCLDWAAQPALYRHLPHTADTAVSRRLAEDLARADALRPGCSLKEAQDVIATLGSFPVFDRLYQDGRRSAGAVAEILVRLTSGILA